VKRFRITVTSRTRGVIDCAITKDGAHIGRLLVEAGPALGLFDAMKAGHVGPAGSGAEVEIVLDPPAPGGAA
jgi:hypothetical protein